MATLAGLRTFPVTFPGFPGVFLVLVGRRDASLLIPSINEGRRGYLIKEEVNHEYDSRKEQLALPYFMSAEQAGDQDLLHEIDHLLYTGGCHLPAFLLLDAAFANDDPISLRSGQLSAPLVSFGDRESSLAPVPRVPFSHPGLCKSRPFRAQEIRRGLILTLPSSSFYTEQECRVISLEKEIDSHWIRLYYGMASLFNRVLFTQLSFPRMKSIEEECLRLRTRVDAREKPNQGVERKNEVIWDSKP